MLSNIFLLLGAVFGAAALLSIAGKSGRGAGIFKNQAAAWVITGVMVIAAIGIGYAKAPVNNPVPEPPLQTVPPAATAAPLNSFVWDNARVLQDGTVSILDLRNQRLWERHRATIGVVTCNYGGDDLYGYTMQCAEDMGLGGYDFIVALDISGDNYWLLQGNDIRRDFTDNDCDHYAYDYMEQPFAKGDYDKAVLQLAAALENWYDSNFN